MDLTAKLVHQINLKLVCLILAIGRVERSFLVEKAFVLRTAIAKLFKDGSRPKGRYRFADKFWMSRLEFLQ
jgi:hypothetical protein